MHIIHQWGFAPAALNLVCRIIANSWPRLFPAPAGCLSCVVSPREIVTPRLNNKRQNMIPVISFLVELKKIILPTARKLRVSQESFDKLSNFDILLTQSLTDKMNVFLACRWRFDEKLWGNQRKCLTTKHERWWWSKQYNGIRVEKFSLFSLAINVYSYCCLLSPPMVLLCNYECCLLWQE